MSEAVIAEPPNDAPEGTYYPENLSPEAAKKAIFDVIAAQGDEIIKRGETNNEYVYIIPLNGGVVPYFLLMNYLKLNSFDPGYLNVVFGVGIKVQPDSKDRVFVFSDDYMIQHAKKATVIDDIADRLDTLHDIRNSLRQVKSKSIKTDLMAVTRKSYTKRFLGSVRKIITLTKDWFLSGAGMNSGKVIVEDKNLQAKVISYERASAAFLVGMPENILKYIDYLSKHCLFEGDYKQLMINLMIDLELTTDIQKQLQLMKNFHEQYFPRMQIFVEP